MLALCAHPNFPNSSGPSTSGGGGTSLSPSSCQTPKAESSSSKGEVCKPGQALLDCLPAPEPGAHAALQPGSKGEALACERGGPQPGRVILFFFF